VWVGVKVTLHLPTRSFIPCDVQLVTATRGTKGEKGFRFLSLSVTDLSKSLPQRGGLNVLVLKDSFFSLLPQNNATSHPCTQDTGFIQSKAT